jgi:hypothetical protein
MKHKKMCKCKTIVEIRNITANVSTQIAGGTNLPDESVGKS